MRKHRQASKVARRRRLTSIPGGLRGTEKAVRWAGGSGKYVCPPAFFMFLWAGALTPRPQPRVPVELEDQQGLGQGRRTHEGKREERREGRGRKTRKEGREIAKRKRMNCNWSLPSRGWGALFVSFYKPVAPGDPRPKQNC